MGEQQALAIGERLRAELDRKSTAALVKELSYIEPAAQEPVRRRLEALNKARADAERELERARTLHGDAQAPDRCDQARLVAIAEHAGE